MQPVELITTRKSLSDVCRIESCGTSDVEPDSNMQQRNNMGRLSRVSGIHKHLETSCNFALNIFIFILCKSPDTRGLKATSRCGLQLFFFRGHCHLLLGLKQGYPFDIFPYECRLGYHQFEACRAGRAESTTSPILCSKCHNRDSNQHPADQTPVLESGALNRSAMTLPQDCLRAKFQILLMYMMLLVLNPT